ncbi:tyrosine-type recombinase/integrase [Massilia varians]|uniref:tyrosine-type recombinase/integrase n=1 Tax=Massilia varians TaxID=457921 RepID=UPI0025554FBA|nr:site-specific integrase [Massilia varians]
MASYAKRANGWRVQVAIQGVRESKVFSTKAEAVAWATRRETEIRAGKAAGVQTGRTVGDAFDRYEKEVSATKRGHRFELLRLAAIGSWKINGAPFRDMKLVDATSEVVGKWRDHRLNTDKVSGSTVNRELNLLSNVFTVAAREWKWISASPTTDVRRPKESEARDRLYTEDEIERICLALGFDLDDEQPITTVSQRVAVAFLFAIETAMRAGEICALVPRFVAGRVVTLPEEITKNGTKRKVPLSKRAVELLELLPAPAEGATIFGITTKSLDTLFRKAKTRAGIEGATFHDSRHLAITRLAKKLHVLDLARMVGHRDLKQLQVYYNETAEEMAKLLD